MEAQLSLAIKRAETAEAKLEKLEDKLRGVQIALCRGNVTTAVLALAILETVDDKVNRATVRDEFERLSNEEVSLGEKSGRRKVDERKYCSKKGCYNYTGLSKSGRCYFHNKKKKDKKDD